MAHTKVTKTYSQNTGVANTFSYSGSFDTFKESEVVVILDTVALTYQSGTINESASPRQYTVDYPNKTVHIGGADLSSGTIVIKPVTDMGAPTARATYTAGSSITASDLNNNHKQLLRKAMEYDEQKLDNSGGTMTGHLTMGEDTTIIFEGATDDGYETTLTVTDPTADRTITIPNVTGTVVTTGDTGTVSETMMAANSVGSAQYIDGSIDTIHIANLQITTGKIAADAVTGAKIADDAIDSEHYVAASIDTEHIKDAQVTTDKIPDQAITTAKIKDNNVTAGQLGLGCVTTVKISDANVTTAKIAADAITGAKIADDVINSEHIAAGAVDLEHMSANSVDSDQYVDGSIDTAHLGDNQVTTAKIADANITTAKIAGDAVNGDKIADDSINSEHYVNSSIDHVHLAGDCVDGDNIADNSVNSEHYVDSSIDHVHLAPDCVDGDNIADDSINSEHYVNSSIDHAHLAPDCVDGDNIADDSINSEHYVADSIDSEHYAAASVDTTALASNAVTTAKITDSNVTTAKVADSNITLAKLASDLKQTSISDSDTQIPTSGAVVDYVAAQIAPIGGLEVIATDAAFPNTQPAAGVVISIADAGGLVVNGSGTSTTGRTVGGSTVTINNIASNFNSSTVDAGVCFQVSSTGSSQTYNYHKATLKEADLLNLSNDINDFAARYRVNAGEPGSNNDAGDLVFDTNASKMKVYDGSSWGEVTSSGDFKYLVMTNAGTTNAATLNGSTVTFDLKETSTSGSAASVTSAAQLMVSVNGVVQKPNTGTSASGLDGFVMADSDTITFCAAPASGDDIFIIQTGSAITPTTPADGTVSTAKIASGAVTTVKIADANVTTAKIADDAVTGAKIADDAVGAEHIEVLDAALQFGDSVKAQFGAGNDLEIYHDGTNNVIDAATSANVWIKNNAASVNEAMAAFRANGAAELYYNGVKTFQTDPNGIRLLGPEGGTAQIELFADEGDDNADKWRVKADTVSSGFYIQNYSSGSWEESIKAHGDGNVELYYDNSKTFETVSGGSKVTGKLEVNGDVQWNGSDGAWGIYWDKSANNASVKDNAYIGFGTSNDLKIYHDGTNSYLDNNTGHLILRTNVNADVGGDIYLKTHDNENAIECVHDGAVSLFNDNVRVFQTAAHGATIANVADAKLLIQGSGHPQLNLNTTGTTDNCSINFGDSGDEDAGEILYAHNGDSMRFYAAGGERFRINSDGGWIVNGDNTTTTNGSVNKVYKWFGASSGNTNWGLENAAADTSWLLERRRTGRSGSHRLAQIGLYENGSNEGGVIVYGSGADSDVSGGVYLVGGNTSWSSNSDTRLKDKIGDITNALTDVAKIETLKFTWKDDTKKVPHIGVTAQSVETILPEAIHKGKVALLKEKGDETEYMAVRYTELIPLCIEALKEAKTKIETLETKVAALEAG